jgi:hypothetical protein
MHLEPLINVHKQRMIAGVIKSMVAGQDLASLFQYQIEKRLYQKCLRLRRLDAESLQRALAMHPPPRVRGLDPESFQRALTVPFEALKSLPGNLHALRQEGSAVRTDVEVATLKDSLTMEPSPIRSENAMHVDEEAVQLRHELAKMDPTVAKYLQGEDNGHSSSKSEDTGARLSIIHDRNTESLISMSEQKWVCSIETAPQEMRKQKLSSYIHLMVIDQSAYFHSSQTLLDMHTLQTTG